MQRLLEKKFEKILAKGDIKINGDRPWDIKVNNPKVYKKVAFKGLMGLGDTYVLGWWDCESLDEMLCRAFRADLQLHMKHNWINYLEFLKAKIFNLQKTSRAFQVGKHHYDIGNDLYELMLDKKTMAYTCGYWKEAGNLEGAQEAKLDLICKKIGLKEGQRILDIGCGWGSFVKFAAEKYRVSCVGITVSKEQVKLAEKRCAGLPVEIRLQDYRDIDEKFDHIISVGMFEHVGYKNYRDYMKVAHRCLKDNGLFLLHTMGQRDSYPDLNHPEYHWILKYIFPNGMLPSPTQIGKSIENLFVMEDWHTFGTDYDKTMMAWFKNFDENWPKLEKKIRPEILPNVEILFDDFCRSLESAQSIQFMANCSV